MYTRTNVVYLFLVLSVLTLFMSNQVQNTYGDVIPKSQFEILNALALFILIITLLPVTRNYILHA
jgi:ABC-type bacteriocin/lantibiotic exporter with double-glycine peptidase domain